MIYPHPETETVPETVPYSPTHESELPLVNTEDDDLPDTLPYPPNFLEEGCDEE